MTSEEVIAKMIELYGDRVCSPDVYPKLFEFQIKMAVHSLKNGL